VLGLRSKEGVQTASIELATKILDCKGKCPVDFGEKRIYHVLSSVELMCPTTVRTHQKYTVT
jgi:hypothetical protein